jgi:hypothetical protein
LEAERFAFWFLRHFCSAKKMHISGEQIVSAMQKESQKNVKKTFGFA